MRIRLFGDPPYHIRVPCEKEKMATGYSTLHKHMVEEDLEMQRGRLEYVYVPENV